MYMYASFWPIIIIAVLLYVGYKALKKQSEEIARKIDRLEESQRALTALVETKNMEHIVPTEREEESLAPDTAIKEKEAQENVSAQKMAMVSTQDSIHGDAIAQQTTPVPPAPIAGNMTSEEINAIAYGSASAGQSKENTAAVSPSDTHEITWDTETTETTETQTDAAIVRFFKWLRRDWPMKVGGLLVILAIGWFVTYAAQEGWLSETARVVLGYLFGIACLTYGIFRAEKVTLQGNIFIVIGIAAIFISTLAGVEFKTVHLSEVAALFIMLGAVALVTLVSLRQKKIALTGVMIFFGATVPLFFFEGAGVNFIFAYIFILTLGTLWVVAKTGWRALTLLMLVVVAFYSIAYMGLGFFADLESWKNLLIAFLFAMVFYFANVAAILIEKKANYYDLTVTIGTAGLFLLWVLMFAPKEVEVFFLLLGVLLFSGASFAIYRFADLKTPTILYAGASLVLLAVATALQFNGATLTIAYLTEVTVTIILAMYITRGTLSHSARVLSVVLYTGPLLLVFAHIAHIFEYISDQQKKQFYVDRIAQSPDAYYVKALERLNASTVADIAPDLFAVFIACVATFMIAAAALHFIGEKKSGDLLFFRVFAYIGGILLALIIWLVTHVFFAQQDVATFVSLVIYTVTGVVFYVYGTRTDYNPYRIIGAILFVVVLARIFFVEIWEMDTEMRMVTFFVLGALFISTAFMSRKRQ